MADPDEPVLVQLRADLIDLVELMGAEFIVLRVCITVAESCDDNEGWEQIGNASLSPRAVVLRKRAASNGSAMEAMPPSGCRRTLARERYGGARLDELIDTVDTLLDDSLGPTMGSRFGAEWRTENDDCPPAGSGTPRIRISALDSLLMASVDPTIARVLGLYYVDRTAPPGRHARL